MTTTAEVKAVRIVAGKPQMDRVELDGDAGVSVRVAAASICGSDLHLVEMGFAEGRVLGHEFAGTTADGTVVAIEPVIGCGSCAHCTAGDRHHCARGATLIGIGVDGGMAEEVVVPASTLVALPSGLDVQNASLVEPLAVAEHGLNRARIVNTDRVLVIGAGAIGLAAIATLRARGIAADVVARHDHQRSASERLGGACTEAGDGYDVVIDAVGSTETVAQAVRSLKPQGRLAMLGVFWEPVAVDMSLLMKEVQLIPAMMYRGNGAEREFSAAARMLANSPDIADVLITHRFPLDGATEAFSTAADRSAGAIKVVFEPNR